MCAQFSSNTYCNSQMKKISKPSKVPPVVKTPDHTERKKPVLNPATLNSSSSLIINMKQELSSIKQEVDKLMTEEDSENISYSPKVDILIRSLKQEVHTLSVGNDALMQQNAEMKNNLGVAKQELVVAETAEQKATSRLEEVEGLKGKLEIEKLKLETEFYRLDGVKAKLEKEQSLSSEIQSKLEEDKLRLQNENLCLQSDLQKARIKLEEGKQDVRWKQEWLELSGQVTLLEDELKVKCGEVETKERQISQLLEELQDSKQKDRDRETLSAGCQIENMRLKALLEQNSVKSEQEKTQSKKQAENLSSFIREQESRISDLLLQANKCQQQQIRIAQLQLQTTRSQDQEIKITNLQNEVRSLQKDKVSAEQSLQSTANQSKISISRLTSDLERQIQTSNSLKAKLAEQQTLNLKLENLMSEYRSNIQSAPSVKEIQLQHDLNERTNQLSSAKSQLEEFRRRLETMRNQNDASKIKISSEQRSLKSHLEIEVQNKRSEMETLKKKMDVLQKRNDSRTAELRQKDQFITNVIVNKVGRESSQSQAQYIKAELSKHFSSTLCQKLASAEDQLIQQKEEIQALREKM